MKGWRSPILATAVVVVAVIVLSFGWWAFREARYRYALWKYSRELAPGMIRGDLEGRLFFEGAPFRQVGSSIWVELGQERDNVGLRPDTGLHHIAI
jgi:hypothetical protein